MEKLAERSLQLKRVAFLAIVLSTIAVTLCLISFPMVFNYIQTLQAEMDNDLAFCKSRSRDLHKELGVVSQDADPEDTARVARSLSAIKDADPEMETAHLLTKRQQQFAFECCTCHRGAPGPTGPPGGRGRNGVPGTFGRPGNNGQPAISPPSPNPFPEQCACEGATGPGGSPGPGGPRGQPGPDGGPGNPGGSGDQGTPGPKGPPGGRGQPGNKGPRGGPGNSRPEQGRPGGPGQGGRPGGNGQPGKAGGPGKDGGSGRLGQPGDPGRPGNDGRPGGPGQPGQPGALGPPGSCDHCPSARLAPGY